MASFCPGIEPNGFNLLWCVVIATNGQWLERVADHGYTELNNNGIPALQVRKHKSNFNYVRF